MIGFDPELLAAVADLPEWDYTDAQYIRAFFASQIEEATGGVPASSEGVDFHDRAITPTASANGTPAVEIPVRVYRPKDSPAGELLPCYLHFHGGAFVLGGLETDHLRLLRYADEAGCVVVSVDYRLAPEHRFPAGVDDCYAAFRWVIEQGEEQLGVDPASVAIGGESAGGAFAAAVALLARDLAGESPILQMLLYPALDDRMQSQSARAMTDTPVWDAEKTRLMWDHYLGAGHEQAADLSPYAAPARVHDHRGLPAAYVLTCEGDPTRDEGVAYALQLMKAGVPVELHSVAGAYHGFDTIALGSALSELSLDEQAAALRRAFAAVDARRVTEGAS